MSEQRHNYEPLPDHLADTGPNRPVRPPMSGWRRAVGVLSLLGAALLTVGTAALLLLPRPAAPPVDPGLDVAAPTLDPTPISTTIPATAAPADPVTDGPALVPVAAPLPTLSPDQAARLLAEPPREVPPVNAVAIQRERYNPFTFIPDRPRSEVTEYIVQAGDTIFQIAEQFGLEPESIAWSNNRNIIGGLQPGQRLNILPYDGAYFEVFNNDTTIQAVATRFRVAPSVIIDADVNGLFGATPDTVLPFGMSVVVPGGQAETIAWSPPVERVAASGSSGGANTTGGRISFAPGDPGSCGLQDNPGWTGIWQRPVISYRWSRGFTSFHTGVDLAGAIGTPVLAASRGRVIFAGWSTWGYGFTVVLAHGDYTTVYGHMSAINVGCGQMVNPGQQVGAIGESGFATGPHLHFEIRYLDVPQDPTFTLAF
ncbi:MAG: peptidoglycan DD-metalloendopeptidase family protein [Chloroflexi bacterium]|nr:peptidoglycan DD-metalloendopeptidase family protein [Chloroflexota bacterium]